MRLRIFNRTIAGPFALVSGLLVVSLVLSCTWKSTSVSVQDNPVASLRDVRFTETSRSTVKLTEVVEYRWKTSEGEGLLRRLFPVDADHSEKLIQQKKFQIESLYREQKSPYPGMLSHTVVCPKELKPVFRVEHLAQADVLRVQAGANSRQGIGVCDLKQAAFEAVILEIYCKEKKVFYEVEGFRPKESRENLETWLSQISCVP